MRCWGTDAAVWGLALLLLPAFALLLKDEIWEPAIFERLSEAVVETCARGCANLDSGFATLLS